MGWSTEVHVSRLTTAVLQAKREARLRRAHKLPEPQGNSGPWPLAAVAGIVLSAVALQRDGRWQQAKSKLSQFCRQLQQRPQQGGSSNSRPHSSQSSPRDKTATASSSGRVALPAAQSQETGSSQAQRKPKSKKKKGRRR